MRNIVSKRSFYHQAAWTVRFQWSSFNVCLLPCKYGVKKRSFLHIENTCFGYFSWLVFHHLLTQGIFVVWVLWTVWCTIDLQIDFHSTHKSNFFAHVEDKSNFLELLKKIDYFFVSSNKVLAKIHNLTPFLCRQDIFKYSKR